MMMALSRLACIGRESRRSQNATLGYVTADPQWSAWFERGNFRGNLAAFRMDPRTHSSKEIDVMQTVAVLPELSAARSRDYFEQ